MKTNEERLQDLFFLSGEVCPMSRRTRFLILICMYMDQVTTFMDSHFKRYETPSE